MRLVIKIARPFLSSGASLEDLIQWGAIGLMRGIKRFDVSRGMKLSTYVQYWIRQQIGRELTNFIRSIRLPHDFFYELRQLEELRADFLRKNDRAPSRSQLMELAKGHGFPDETLARLEQAKILMEPLVPLDAAIDASDASGRSNHEVFTDPTVPDPVEALSLETAVRALQAAIGELTDRQQMVIRRRFFPPDMGNPTLTTVGAEMGLSRERIRQIQGQATKALRVKLEASGFSKADLD